MKRRHGLPALRLANPPDESDKKKAEAEATKWETDAKALSALADEAEKSLAALFAADAAGNSTIESAIRGGMLRKSPMERVKLP